MHSEVVVSVLIHISTLLGSSMNNGNITTTSYISLVPMQAHSSYWHEKEPGYNAIVIFGNLLNSYQPMLVFSIMVSYSFISLYGF